MIMSINQAACSGAGQAGDSAHQDHENEGLAPDDERIGGGGRKTGVSCLPVSAMRKERQNYDPAETCEGQRKRLKGSSLWVLCRRGGSSQVRGRRCCEEQRAERVLQLIAVTHSDVPEDMRGGGGHSDRGCAASERYLLSSPFLIYLKFTHRSDTGSEPERRDTPGM